MTYQVIARRWRPQNFNEVVHQDHVLKTIRNAIANGRISHAYIFTGPRGVGKTTVARILAKSLNCINGPTPEPCGVCDNCVEIKNGTSFDVYEIDGASNTSVDNVRDLREKVNFAPVKGRYKIYIIDEVHMLSTGAFNALLKTLEEPPPHVIFVFATTEIHKVPDTILSRCQKFQFRKIPVDIVAAHLKKILDADKIEYDADALYPIARAGGGSMRDAQSLLEQAIAFSSGKITAASALESLGVVPFSSYCSLLAAASSSDAESALAEINRICTSGVNLQLYAAGLLEIIRSVRLSKNGINAGSTGSFSPEETSEIKKLSESFADEELSAFFKIVSAMIVDMKSAEDERLNIEMALLDMIALRKRPSLADIIRKLEGAPLPLEKKKLEPALAQKTSESAVPSLQPPPRQSAAPQAMATAIASKSMNAGVPSAVSADELASKWKNFLDDCRKVKSYLYHRIQSDYAVSFATGAVKLSQQSAGKGMDAQDLSFISGWFERKGVAAQIAVGATEDEPPLPEEETIVPDYGVTEKPSGAVQMILDKFQGEIVEKRTQKMPHNEND